jgi:hypothetical protein
MNISRLKAVRKRIYNAKPEDCNMYVWRRECGCFGSFTEQEIRARTLTGDFIGAETVGSFLGMTTIQQTRFLYSYPEKFTNHKEWMLKRIDAIIRNKRVVDVGQ